MLVYIYIYRCQDYVRIRVPGFGETEICGSEVTEEFRNQLMPSM